MKKIVIYLIIGFVIVSNISSATILAVSGNNMSTESLLVASSRRSFIK